MLSNGLMIFVRLRDDDGEIDNNACQTYDYICLSVISTGWLIYERYTRKYLEPRIMEEEHNKLAGLTGEKFEKVSQKCLELVTRQTLSQSFGSTAVATNEIAITESANDNDHDSIILDNESSCRGL